MFIKTSSLSYRYKHWLKIQPSISPTESLNALTPNYDTTSSQETIHKIANYRTIYSTYGIACTQLKISVFGKILFLYHISKFIYLILAFLFSVFYKQCSYFMCVCDQIILCAFYLCSTKAMLLQCSCYSPYSFCGIVCCFRYSMFLLEIAQ